jgi:hypothetical protein
MMIARSRTTPSTITTRNTMMPRLSQLWDYIRDIKGIDLMMMTMRRGGQQQWQGYVSSGTR